jgi:hypothetical protein
MSAPRVCVFVRMPIGSTGIGSSPDGPAQGDGGRDQGRPLEEGSERRLGGRPLLPACCCCGCCCSAILPPLVPLLLLILLLVVCRARDRPGRRRPAAGAGHGRRAKGGRRQGGHCVTRAARAHTRGRGGSSVGTLGDVICGELTRAGQGRSEAVTHENGAEERRLHLFPAPPPPPPPPRGPPDRAPDPRLLHPVSPALTTHLSLSSSPPARPPPPHGPPKRLHPLSLLPSLPSPSSSPPAPATLPTNARAAPPAAAKRGTSSSYRVQTSAV